MSHIMRAVFIISDSVHYFGFCFILKPPLENLTLVLIDSIIEYLECLTIKLAL